MFTAISFSKYDSNYLYYGPVKIVGEFKENLSHFQFSLEDQFFSYEHIRCKLFCYGLWQTKPLDITLASLLAATRMPDKVKV